MSQRKSVAARPDRYAAQLVLPSDAETVYAYGLAGLPVDIVEWT